MTAWLAIGAIVVGHVWSAWQLGRAGWPARKHPEVTITLRDASSTPSAEGRTEAPMDLVYLGLAGAFFALSLALIELFERL